jgi:hypothetical protein
MIQAAIDSKKEDGSLLNQDTLFYLRLTEFTCLILPIGLQRSSE